ncbi:MAG: response regulator receiver protein [Nitrosarchaeum sp.]|jgi:two-component system chemotaxis response regulator CheY|nr:response regulator receiver protein [Nitrosarchaeum sp.]
MANILIADDSNSIRMILKEILMIDNHSVVGEAKDGKETIDLYLALHPDLLLLDLKMPKKDGLTVVKEITSKHSDAKIILITASDNQKIIQLCLDSGALSFISKPFDFKNVLKVVSEILAK